MTTMDAVNKILADIDALPAEYKPLVQKEASWIQKNWGLATLGALGVGYVLGAAHLLIVAVPLALFIGLALYFS